MTEKKYENVSEMIIRLRNEPGFSYNTNKILNKQFINKDKLRDKIEFFKDKSEDFECCLEVLNEILKFLGE